MKQSVSRSLLLISLAVVAFVPVVCGQEGAGAADFSALFTKTDAMIPMRDGIKLHTEIYVPKDVREPLPFFLTRSPYGLHDDAKGYTPLLALYREMFSDGYIFVFQDIRGKYGSEGQFVMQRPPRNR